MGESGPVSKKQHNRCMWAGECNSVAVYKNAKSGKLFFGKSDLNAKNRVRVTSATVDSNGVVTLLTEVEA